MEHGCTVNIINICGIFNMGIESENSRLKKDIVIVGGGTAGLVAALMIQRSFPLSRVKLIKSSELGIIGVGEGVSYPFNDFLRYVGIDDKEIINNTDATIKTGILFKDWNYKGHMYIHSDDGSSPDYYNVRDLEMYRYKVVKNPNDSPFILSNEFSRIYESHSLRIPSDLSNKYLFHFDTYKLNSYLLKKCEDRNIRIVDSTIESISQDGDGNITGVNTFDKENIKGDFFVDCSGFKRVLSSKLGSKYISCSDFLPMNQAITFSTGIDNPNRIEPYTTTTALSNGWTWKIPTQKKYGNGYVFSNQHTDSDNALNELNNHLGTNVEKVAKDIKFNPGRVEKFWFKNCISVGLSGGFIEPLEAQSIGFSIMQIRCFVDTYYDWLNNNKISSLYNTQMVNSFDNILSYVQLHYLNTREDTKFWKSKNFEITGFNKSTYSNFCKGEFDPSIFQYRYNLFDMKNFYQVYYGLNLLTKDSFDKTKNPIKFTTTPPIKIPSVDNNDDIMYHEEYLRLLKI